MDRSGESRYLHPVVRHYRRGVLAAEHHVTENLENEWTGAVHREPLQAFFERELALPMATAVYGGDVLPPSSLCEASPHPASRDQPSAVLRPSAWCSLRPSGR